MGTIGRVASRPASEGLGHEGLAKAGASPWCWLEALALAFIPLRSPLSPAGCTFPSWVWPCRD